VAALTRPTGRYDRNVARRRGATAVAAPRSRAGSVRREFATAESVYGTILVAGLILAISSHEEPSLGVFWGTIATVLVFWAAHVYAATVAYHGDDGGEIVTLGAAFRRALRHSNGLIVAAVIPLIPIYLGVIDVLDDDDAVDYALWSAVLILGVLGYLAFHERGSRIWVRIVGAIGTAFFGIVIIVINSFVH